MTEVLRAIGLMSGTSMDGIDIALIETDGDSQVSRLADHSVGYSDAQRRLIQTALADAKHVRSREERPGSLAAAEVDITNAHIGLVRSFLEREGLSSREIDVIGFHGQTVLHKPDEQLTVQIGDGAGLARAVRIQTVGDLRAADVAAGGQGAPLAPAYHRAMAASLQCSPAVLVNIGGVSNVTYVGSDGELLAFDTGPGNALIDDLVSSKTGAVADLDGALARAGRGQFPTEMLEQMLDHAYFKLKPPKSLDRNAFSSAPAEHLTLEAGAALLSEFTAACLARSTEWFPERPREWVICGGGRKNSELMWQIRQRLEHDGTKISLPEDHGFNGDSVEAEAFAYLAVRSLRGLPLSFPGTTGCPEPLSGGVLYPV